MNNSLLLIFNFLDNSDYHVILTNLSTGKEECSRKTRSNGCSFWLDEGNDYKLEVRLLHPNGSGTFVDRVLKEFRACEFFLKDYKGRIHLQGQYF